jgi:hypothetical protein
MRARLAFGATAVLASFAACSAGAPDAASTTTAAAAVVAVGPVAATELVVGDCLGQVAVGARERTMIQAAQVVSCERQHQLEVFATFALDPAELETDPPGAYPGQQRVVTAADQGCTRELESLADTDDFGLIALWPTADSWQQGDRTIACAAFLADGTPFETRQLLAGG